MNEQSSQGNAGSKEQSSEELRNTTGPKVKSVKADKNQYGEQLGCSAMAHAVGVQQQQPPPPTGWGRVIGLPYVSLYMGTAPYMEGRPGDERSGDGVDPRPLPRDERRGDRSRLACTLAASAAIVGSEAKMAPTLTLPPSSCLTREMSLIAAIEWPPSSKKESYTPILSLDSLSTSAQITLSRRST